jgi:hypothetical protein
MGAMIVTQNLAKNASIKRTGDLHRDRFSGRNPDSFVRRGILFFRSLSMMCQMTVSWSASEGNYSSSVFGDVKDLTCSARCDALITNQEYRPGVQPAYKNTNIRIL